MTLRGWFVGRWVRRAVVCEQEAPWARQEPLGSFGKKRAHESRGKAATWEMLGAKSTHAGDGTAPRWGLPGEQHGETCLGRAPLLTAASAAPPAHRSPEWMQTCFIFTQNKKSLSWLFDKTESGKAVFKSTFFQRDRDVMSAELRFFPKQVKSQHLPWVRHPWPCAAHGDSARGLGHTMGHTALVLPGCPTRAPGAGST